jgi:hypothetical protein
VLGSIYNTQTNPTTNAAWATPTGGTFRVPDYRGIFLRSSGSPSGQSVVTVGGHQSDALQAHQHSGTTGAMNSNSSHSHRISNAGNTGSNYLSRGGNGIAVYVQQNEIESTNTDHTHGITTSSTVVDSSNGTPRTSTETRPTNKGVLYIIKV